MKIPFLFRRHSTQGVSSWVPILFVAISVFPFAPLSDRWNRRMAMAGQTPPAQVTVRGTVTDTENQPLQVYVSISTPQWASLGDATTSKTGEYRFQVPYSEGYILQVQGAEKRIQIESDVIPTGHLDQFQYVVPSGNEVVADFKLRPAGSIWLMTYDRSGNYLFRQDVNQNNWTAAVYPAGEPPTSHPLQYLNHQTNMFWGWRNGSDKNHAVLLVPSGQPVDLWIYFRIPEVGDTFLHLDNDGKGYQVAQGEVIRANILFDAAKTEFRLFQERFQEYLADGYHFSDTLADWLNTAASALRDAERLCSEDDMGGCMTNAYTVLSRVLRSREEAAYQAALQDIDRYRKGDAKVRILGCNGSPLGGLRVDYWQTSQDFIFGAGWPENDQLPVLADAGFNGAIQEAWWGEVTKDGVEYKYWDDRFQPIVDQGMKVIMHTGVWISPVTNSNWYFYPKVIDRMTPESIAELAGDFSEKFSSHYRDRISIYNAFNEPQNAFYTFPLTMQDVVRIAARSVAGAGKGAPDVPTYINFYNMYLGGDMTWYMNPENATYPAPKEILQAILREGVPFTDIGLEFYSGFAPSTTDFGIFNDALEFYGKFGKKVFLSELSYDAAGSSADYGTWHESRSARTQADWARYAYTIAYGKPYTTGIVWVPASASNTSGELKGHALFDVTGKPRLVVDEIGKLIHSWTTSGSGRTDGSGSLSWNGFYGRYQIQWTNPDGIKGTAELVHRNGAADEFMIQSEGCKPLQTATIPGIELIPSGGNGNSIFIILVAIISAIVVAVYLFYWRNAGKHNP